MAETLLSRLNAVLDKPQSAAEQEQIRKGMLDCVMPGLGYSVFFLIGSAALYGHVPTILILIAGVSIVLEAVYKIGKVNVYRAQSATDRADPAWRRVIWPGALYTGFFFGLSALTMLLPLPSANLMVLAFSYMGVYIMSCWLGSCYMPIAIAKLVPLTLPLSIGFLFMGSITCLLVSFSLLITLSLSLIYIHGMVRQSGDLVNARHRIEELYLKLDKEKQSAEQLVIDKSRFIASASHDLRQPLHALGLFHSAIRARVDDDKIHSLMDSVDKSTGALNHLFEGLLDVSHLDAGVIEPDPEHFSVGSLFGSMHDEFQQLAHAKQLSLNITNDSCVLYADPLLVERILRNLLSNAIEFTDEGSVELAAFYNGNNVVLSVSDTGPGIPASEVENIFNEFHQIGRSAHHDEKGFGLGLAIVRRIAQLLDVSPEVTQVEPHGSSFSLELPAGSRELIARSNEVNVVEDIRVGTRIMIVDDNVTILDGMETALEDWGVDCLVASSIDEALQSLDETGFMPDLLICDFHLNDHRNGVAAAGIICKHLVADIPFIVITGDTSIESTEELVESELQILYKPVRPGKLRESIVSNLRYAARDELLQQKSLRWN